MSIAEKQAEIIEEFEFFEDWMEKYEHIIELGKDLPLIDEKHQDEDHIIKGCQSQVWLHAEMQENKLRFTANSDAIITKGLIALVVRVLDNESPKDIAEAELNFAAEIGLSDHLSPTRSNGLLAMIKQMKFYALAFQAQSSI